ncbi:hypothetical protein EXIGLDRAFT_838729 [Exidia glandulosa HHB12029]|uniref:F-box domain-containing protein n=1 Tax=Exidia glandulosa HHB12029 TaxID=1314781 RepID=A0A165FJR0_EXIGL|nr:hypothetical protein EXIGLDRAFT_838729 [Exidia glandulosa HHB12029]
MFHRLPVELVCDVVQIAASYSLQTSVSGALELTLVSSTVRAAVLPVVYHTLLITTRNLDRLSLVGRGLQYVSRLFVAKDVDDMDQFVVLLRQCIKLEWLEATWQVIAALEQAPLVHATKISFRYQSLKSVTRLPATTAQHVTHIEGYIFPFSFGVESGPKIWVERLLESLPVLTHVGLTLASADAQTVSDFMPSHVLYLLATLRAFLWTKEGEGRKAAPTGVERIVLHICGVWVDPAPWSFLSRRIKDELMHEARQFDTIADGGVEERRVYVWTDQRQFLAWDEEESHRADDAMTKVNVWDMGIPLAEV